VSRESAQTRCKEPYFLEIAVLTLYFRFNTFQLSQGDFGIFCRLHFLINPLSIITSLCLDVDSSRCIPRWYSSEVYDQLVTTKWVQALEQVVKHSGEMKSLRHLEMTIRSVDECGYPDRWQILPLKTLIRQLREKRIKISLQLQHDEIITHVGSDGQPSMRMRRKRTKDHLRGIFEPLSEAEAQLWDKEPMTNTPYWRRCYRDSGQNVIYRIKAGPDASTFDQSSEEIILSGEECARAMVKRDSWIMMYRVELNHEEGKLTTTWPTRFLG